MGRLEYSKVIKYRVIIRNITQLHIGSSLNGNDDILTDAITGYPFIQASSLSGMFRSAFRKIDEKHVSELFGRSKSEENTTFDKDRGRLVFTDGLIVDPSNLKLEIRPGVSIDRKTGTVRSENGSGQKFDTTYVSYGTDFKFYVYLYEEVEHPLYGIIEKLFGIMTNGEARLGAKKSSGAGLFEAVSIEKAEFDLTTGPERKEWILEEENKIKYDLITDKCTTIRKDIKYELVVKSTTEGPLQVKGIAMSDFGEDAADSENIKNGRGDFIIPGSSLRGAIRSRMERIADYLNKRSVIDGAFGCKKDEHSDSYSGNLMIEDAVIVNARNNEENPIRNRIHIDKFTGGVINQEWFKEKNAVGNVTIKIQIRDKNNPDATLGLLLYAIRDIAVNMVNLGNGFATGKGFLNVDTAIIKTSDEEDFIINFKQKTGNDNELVKNAIKSLKEA